MADCPQGAGRRPSVSTTLQHHAPPDLIRAAEPQQSLKGSLPKGVSFHGLRHGLPRAQRVYYVWTPDMPYLAYTQVARASRREAAEQRETPWVAGDEQREDYALFDNCL